MRKAITLAAEIVGRVIHIDSNTEMKPCNNKRNIGKEIKSNNYCYRKMRDRNREKSNIVQNKYFFS